MHQHCADIPTTPIDMATGTMRVSFKPCPQPIRHNTNLDDSVPGQTMPSYIGRMVTVHTDLVTDPGV